VNIGGSLSGEDLVDKPVCEVFEEISPEFAASREDREHSTYTYKLNGVSRRIEGRKSLLEALVAANISMSGQDREEHEIQLESNVRARGGRGLHAECSSGNQRSR
jgi:hypothetical protein